MRTESKHPLSSYNEWGTLREIVVGNPFPSADYLIDYSFCHFHFDNLSSHIDMISNIKSESHKSNTLRYRSEYLQELNEDIEGLCLALRDYGANVLRPRQIVEDNIRIELPYWESSIWPALNVRDRILVLGDNLIETTPCIRSRYLETDLLKDIIYDYFDKGANWISMPRPIMTDRSFDVSYINNSPMKTASRELVDSSERSYFDIGLEILMDAANCLRLGKDVIVNVADKNQDMAFDWLCRVMGDRFNFHKINSLTDNHIDSFVIIIRPGLVLVRNKNVINKLPEFMSRWDYVVAPEPTEDLFPSYESDSALISSKYIDTNILSLDENTVIVNSLNPGLIKTLEGMGLEVVPVRHRHRRLFGGGFHCFTLDTNRDSELVSYR